MLGEATRREVGDTIATTRIREMRTMGVVQGYTYSGSAIVAPDGFSPPPESSLAYIPSARFGNQARLAERG